MGSTWKMFTQAQGQELIDGTNSTWTTINGVNGRKFTSKTDSSKYIFLPAGGIWDSANHMYIGQEYEYGVIYRCVYWTSTYYSSPYKVGYYLHTELNAGVQSLRMSTLGSQYGCSVRAIHTFIYK